MYNNDEESLIFNGQSNQLGNSVCVMVVILLMSMLREVILWNS